MLSDVPIPALGEFGALSEDEQSRLARFAGPPASYARQSNLRHQGESPDFVYILVEGWACSAVTLLTGERQIMKIHLPGDVMGTSSLCLREAADTLFALTPVVARKMPAGRFAELFASSREFAARMFLTAEWERIGMMDRLAAVGAKPATGRLASLLLDLHERLGKLGQVREGEFVLRLTQDEIGDYLGLTSVHVNRTFRQMEEGGLIGRRLQRVKLLDLGALKEMSGFVAREINAECIRHFHRPPPRGE